MSSPKTQNQSPVQKANHLIISTSGELEDLRSEEDVFGGKEKKPEVIEPVQNALFQAINPFLQTKVVAELILSIQPDKWYNIPVTKQTNDRQKKNNANVKKMDKAIIDIEEQHQRHIDQLQRTLTEKMLRISNDVTYKVELCEARFEELHQKVQRDREFIDTKLSRIDDTAIVKKWVENKFGESNYELNHRIDLIESHFNKLLDKVFNDNLLVPGMIGNGQGYPNLKEYLIEQHSILHQKLKHLDDKSDQIVSISLDNVKTKLQKDIQKLKKTFQMQLEGVTQTQLSTLKDNIGDYQTQNEAIHQNIDKVEEKLQQQIIEYQVQLDLLTKKLDTSDNNQYLIELKKNLVEVKDQLVESVKQLETQVKAKIQEINNERKDFEIKTKKQLDLLNKNVGSSITNSNSPNSNTNIKLTKRNSNFGGGALENIKDEEASGVLNIQMQSNNVMKSPKSKLTANQINQNSDKISPFQSKTKQQQQNEPPKSPRGNQDSRLSKNTAGLPQDYQKEIEKLIDVKLTQFKTQYQRSFNDSSSLREGQNFRIGNGGSSSNNNHFKNSDKNSMISGGTTRNGPSQLRKNLLQTQQNFSNHIKYYDTKDSQHSYETQRLRNYNSDGKEILVGGENSMHADESQAEFQVSPQHLTQDRIAFINFKQQYKDHQGLRDLIQTSQDTINLQENPSRMSKEEMRPRSKNREQFLKFAQNTVRAFQKYEHDMKNSFKIPPILNNKAARLNTIERTFTAQVGDDSIRNAHNLTTVRDNELSRSLNNGHAQFGNLSLSKAIRKTNLTINQPMPLAVKFESINDKFDH
ncbi:UNKNOWN [Stylonychia lemnae]|uniref:Uncharacterized protein n=1 Tax=Stylonychia lemnae TaxID=5949 RepID=A0A077ZN71_STYLE|nr:UNKNOWN [Stylonychia lemnae]|eukprot:CDW71368.1 UNKNOWN [Stylonychia lemnae]